VIDLRLGDCLEVMRTLPDASVDAIVTDPPYGLSFMGKKWDYDVPSVAIWAECLRVLKPGGHLLAFAGTRTQHRMAIRIEDAGFEIRDMIAWVYGSGFPKSLDVSKAIDKAAGARGHDSVGFNVAGKTSGLGVIQRPELRSDHPDYVKPQGITPEAQQWQGWGTALKPALEPITMARKPLTGTVAANVLEHGTGALNVDGCRVGTEDNLNGGAYAKNGSVRHDGDENWRYKREGGAGNFRQPQGRWPANLIHDGSDEVVGLLPEANSARVGNPNNPHRGINHTATSYGQGDGRETHDYRDTGSAARFFYTAKVSKSERGAGNTHPTVKPIALMRYLCRLVTPPGGVVLDPFMGSGSTGKAAILEDFAFIGIELDSRYFEIATARINNEPIPPEGDEEDEVEVDPKIIEQLRLRGLLP
jgi:site-specific DNA-methyltransferase (adenine-specific)